MQSKVRLGIEAPKDVPVHRQEVHEAIKREDEHAESQDPRPNIEMSRKRKIVPATVVSRCLLPVHLSPAKVVQPWRIQSLPLPIQMLVWLRLRHGKHL